MFLSIFKTRGTVIKLDRRRKARMIEAFLADQLGGEVRGKRILDIGCGNGCISSYFSKYNSVVSVDIEDQRWKAFDSSCFVQVDSANLPFDDESFDIVLSHHVIEHVPEQGVHLDEMYRVLRGDGVGYLGTPNRTSPVMEGHLGNDIVLHYSQMVPLFNEHGFEAELLSIRLVSEPEAYHGDLHFGRYLPRFLLKWLVPIFPSQYYILRKL